ncbi:MAG: hypothetical protein J6U52_07885, partial [Alistipes sp.]|nr:hypothetical protein [Alistipes sp.]
GLADRIIEGIAMGVELPDTVSEQGGALEQVTPSALAEPMEANPLDADPAEAPAPPIPQEVKKALNVAAGELLRYLFDRFTYRWEQWMDRLREKRAIRQAEQEDGAESATTEQVVTTSDPQVQASSSYAAVQAARRSVIAFDSGQRRYEATPVKQIEDPSLNQPLFHSNDKAYTDDAKAFCR